MVSVTENYLSPLTSNQTCCDEATFTVCNVQCKDWHSFRFQKTPVPLTFMASKSPFPIHANPIASPWSEKKRVSSQMLHCGSVQTKFVTYFKRSLFSHRMSPSVALSLLILFFMGLILNAGIKEASKNRREADVWWGWHRWNDAHFSAGQPTSLFPTCL